MILSTWDYLIIVSFISLIVFVGLRFKNKASKDTNSFFLGGRNLPWWIAGTSMVATTFAADTPLAVTELVAQSGISGNWLWWNMMIGGMFTTFFFAKYWRRAQILTDVEFLELRYSGTSASFLRGFRAVYLGLFLNAIIIGWVNLAMMSLLEVFFELSKIEALAATAFLMLLVAIYSGLSGLLGVVYTDVIQFIAAMAGSIILAVIVLNSNEINGISNLKAALPDGTLSFVPTIDFNNSLSENSEILTLSLGSFLAFIGFQWWASWYPGNEPGGGGYIAQRMMSTKNEKHAIYSSLFFQIAHYCLRPWPWIIVALCAVVLYPELPEADYKLGYAMAMKDFLPNGLRGLLLAAFLAAYMSTISTQLNWGSSYLLNDFYRRFIKPESSEQHYIFASRMINLFLMVFAIFITSQIESISNVWKFLIEAGAGLGLVLIVRWFWWRVNAWSEIAATVIPLICYALSRYGLNMEFPETFFITVGGTTIGWIIITLVTPKVDHRHLKNFYDKIKPAGNWKPFSEGKNPENKKVISLILSWLISVVLGYSLLFSLGHIVLENWDQLPLSLGLFLMSTLLLNKITSKIELFK
ncbi:MAG: sodium:solute symporter family protein [Bacteroidota bacterium]